MKQLIQSYKTGKITLEEVPRPQVLPGMVLVETMASVISAGTEKMMVDLARKSLVGKARARPDLVRKVIATAKREGFVSTLQKVRSKLETPIPLGYSCAGVIREVGPGVDQFQPGDPVACAGAGYASHSEFNLVPKNLCVRIPERKPNDLLPFEEAAFATVGAIALQGVRQAALTIGERVCVIGLGLLGQLAAQLCAANGCRVIGADIDPSKLELAGRLGIDQAVLTGCLDQKSASFSDGVGVDAVIITASSMDSSLVELAGRISRIKGRIVVVGLVGMEVPRDLYYKKELDLRLSLSYGPGRYDPEFEERGHDYPIAYVRWTEQRNMEAFLDLVAAGRVGVRPLVTHRFGFEEVLGAYNLILNKKEPYLGVVLGYSPGIEPKRIPIITGKSQKNASVGIGVIGAGNFARGVLLPVFGNHHQVSFRGVATARGMTAKAVAEQFKFSYCTDNTDEILKDSSTNSVVLATRHNLHGPLVLKALQSGKHVFVEKPLCLNLEEMKEIVDHCLAASRNGGSPMLMVGFNRRFSLFTRKIKSMVDGRSGPLVAAYRVNAGPIPKDSWIQDPVEGGGRIIGEVCHFIDTLRFLVGAPVRSVQAACVRGGGTSCVNRDSVAITLTYTDGSLGTVLYHSCGNSSYPKEHLEVSCGGNMAVLEDYCRLDIYGCRKQSMKGARDKGFEAEVDAFVKSVANGGASPIPLDELIETTQVTFAIHAALNTGRTILIDELQNGVSE